MKILKPSQKIAVLALLALIAPAFALAFTPTTAAVSTAAAATADATGATGSTAGSATAAGDAAGGASAKSAKAGNYHAGAREVLRTDDLTQLKGAPAETLAGLAKKKFLFVYFSAHWCPPCKAFTPKLVEWYNTNKKNGDFEVLFVSGDHNEGARVGYMREAKMPWAGVKLSAKKAKEFFSRFHGPGIPNLILLNEDDELLQSSFEDGKYVGPYAALKKYARIKAGDAAPPPPKKKGRR